MKRTLRYLSWIFLLLFTVFIPILFLVKFDNYRTASAVNNEQGRFIVLKQEDYDALEDYRNLRLETKKKQFKAKVIGKWEEKDNLYIARIDSTYYFKETEVNIYINSTNIFKMKR